LNILRTIILCLCFQTLLIWSCHHEIISPFSKPRKQSYVVKPKKIEKATRNSFYEKLKTLTLEFFIIKKNNKIDFGKAARNSFSFRG